MTSIDIVFIYITILIAVYILGVTFIVRSYPSNSMNLEEEHRIKILDSQLDMLLIVASAWPVALVIVPIYFIIKGSKSVIYRLIH